MTTPEDMLETVDTNGSRAIGRSQYRKYLQGGELSRKDAIKAHCYLCMGFETAENSVCTNKTCPLFPFRNYSATTRPR